MQDAPTLHRLQAAGQKKGRAVIDEKPEMPPRHPTLREFARARGVAYHHAYFVAPANQNLVVRIPGGRGPVGWSYRVTNPETLAAAMAERLAACRSEVASYFVCLG